MIDDAVCPSRRLVVAVDMSSALVANRSIMSLLLLLADY